MVTWIKAIFALLILSLAVSAANGQSVLNQGNANSILRSLGGYAADKWFILPNDTLPELTTSLIRHGGLLAYKYPNVYVYDTVANAWVIVNADTSTLNDYYIHNDTLNLQQGGFKVAYPSYSYRLKAGESLTGFLTNNQNQFHVFVGYDSTNPPHNHPNPLGADRRGCISAFTRVDYADTATGIKQIRGILGQASLRLGNEYDLPAQQHPTISALAGQFTIEQGAEGSIDEGTTLYLSATAGTTCPINQASLIDATYGSFSNNSRCIGIRLAQVNKGSISNIWNYYTTNDSEIQPDGNWLNYDSSSTSTTLPNYFKGQMRLGNPADLGSNYKVQASGDIIFSKKLHAYDTLKIENELNKPIKIGANGLKHTTTGFRNVTIGENDTINAQGGHMLNVVGVLQSASGTPNSIASNTQFTLTGSSGARSFLAQPGGTAVDGIVRGFLFNPTGLSFTGTGTAIGFTAANTVGYGFEQNGASTVINHMYGNLALGGASYSNPTNAKLAVTGTIKGDSIFTTIDNAYASSWNGSLKVPNENVLYDKIETLAPASAISGTANTIPLFATSSTLGNSVITQSSSNIGIGMTPTEELTVLGTVQVHSKTGADNILMNFTNSIGLNYARIFEASTGGLGGMVFDGYRNSSSGLGVLFRGFIASSGALAHEFRGQGGTLSTTVAYPSPDLTLFSHVIDGAGNVVNDFKISATGVTTHYNPTNANSVIETVSNAGVITRDATGASASHVFSDPVTINGQTNTQNVEPITDDTYYLGENSSTTPHAYKGLILKDQSNGNYYRIEMVAGVLTTTLL